MSGVLARTFLKQGRSPYGEARIKNTGVIVCPMS